MSIDLKTLSLEPQRRTFDHLARRFGDKPASRYQEASYDLQATEHLHYRPTWDPEQALYDPDISRIRMRDWYDLKDPRQFYYNTYTITRSRQQDTAEANFSFVESRDLGAMLSDEVKQVAMDVLMPLRHATWGANNNNTFICAYGYSVIFTQACMYHAMDNLAIAQYLSRLGLMLGGPEALVEGKQAWLQNPGWQELRHYVEDCLVTRDPIELFLAQNFVLDGLLYPLVYEHIVDEYLAMNGGSSVAMLTQFMNDWFKETQRWIDAVLKVMASESEENREVLIEWMNKWAPRAQPCLTPVEQIVYGDDSGALLEEIMSRLKARAKKAGIEF